MKLPEEFELLAEDRETLSAIAVNVEVIAELFAGDQGTTEGLRMAAASFRAGADRLDLIAKRVEAMA